VFKNPTIDFSVHFSALLAIVRVALVRSSWRSSFMRAALFIMRATSSSLVFTFSLQTSLFIHPHRQKSDMHGPISNSCIFTPIENWTHVYMNLLTRNSPYYHLLKYLLFLLKHPVYVPPGLKFEIPLPSHRVCFLWFLWTSETNSDYFLLLQLVFVLETGCVCDVIRSESLNVTV